ELIFPTGNQHRGNGAGRTSVALTLLSSYAAAPWTFHSNVGISSNRYALPEDQEVNEQAIWRSSRAVSYDVNEQWQVLVDVGVARNPERIRHLNPAYFLTGVVYAPTKDIDLDVGLKFGLNNAEVTRQVGVGLAWRF
ncbi:MAG: transporter, partial [Glaciimonas sp.]|nr:transporter [Glaciimonas sp.]